jgi:hypothetical protein
MTGMSMEKEILDRVYEQMKAKQFELGAQTSGIWKITARNLKRAADKLYSYYHDATTRDIKRFIEEIESGQRKDGARKLEGDEWEDLLDGQLISIYFLLIGYAFENLFKGILMLEHPEYFRPSAKIKDIQSHNLKNLCHKCNISLQQEEAELLEMLTIYVEWQGKYPIPLESKNMWPIRQPDGSWKTRGEAFDGRKTQDKVDNLYIKILDELERRQKSTSRT